MVLSADMFAGGAFVALLLGLGAMAFVVVAVLYVYISWTVMTIANKTKTKNSWLAWIPIANFYLLTQIANVSGLWTLALLLSFIPVAGGLAVAGVSIWLFWRIAERRKFPGWISLLLLVPGVNLVVLGIIAWAK
jgi:hypothetical protein